MGRGRGERTQVGACGQQPASPEREVCGGLKAGGGVSSQQRFPPILVSAALGPPALLRCPHRHYSVAFTLLLIHIYFIY